jgi:hypothetical protein
MFDCAATGMQKAIAANSTVKAVPIARRLEATGRLKVGLKIVMPISSFLSK